MCQQQKPIEDLIVIRAARQCSAHRRLDPQVAVNLGGGEFLRQQNAYERTAQAPGPSIAGSRRRLLRLVSLQIRKASPHRRAARARPNQMESFER